MERLCVLYIFVTGALIPRRINTESCGILGFPDAPVNERSTTMSTATITGDFGPSETCRPNRPTLRFHAKRALATSREAACACGAFAAAAAAAPFFGVGAVGGFATRHCVAGFRYAAAPRS